MRTLWLATLLWNVTVYGVLTKDCLLALRGVEASRAFLELRPGAAGHAAWDTSARFDEALGREVISHFRRQSQGATLGSGNPEVIYALFNGQPRTGALSPTTHWEGLNRAHPTEAAAIRAHVDELDTRLRAGLPKEEAAQLRIQTVEVRYVAGGGEEVQRPGHLDGRRTAFTMTTALVGRGTWVQDGPGPRLNFSQPIREVPRGHTLILTGLGRTDFYGGRGVTVPATLHESAPLGAEPRLMLIVRYRYAPRGDDRE